MCFELRGFEKTSYFAAREDIEKLLPSLSTTHRSLFNGQPRSTWTSHSGQKRLFLKCFTMQERQTETRKNGNVNPPSTLVPDFAWQLNSSSVSFLPEKQQ